MKDTRAALPQTNEGPAAKPEQAHKLAFDQLDDRSEGSAAPLRGDLGTTLAQTANPLHHVQTTLTVCVGKARISVGELVGAKEHQVLKLDSELDSPVDILLEGNVIARGMLVAVGDHFGVRITELPRPLST